MKIFLMIATCMLLLQYAHAQQKNNADNNTGTNSVPVVQKGYYSIYKNAEQLSKKGRVNSDVIGITQKGYYAIGHNKDKAVKRSRYNNNKPVIPKGYYAIGNNHKKL
jgi:hypothetical protein